MAKDNCNRLRATHVPTRPALFRTLPPTLPLLLALLTGCASTLDTQVTTFHRVADGLAGQRFVIRPTPAQRDSLEFDSYAGYVRDALTEKGLVPAPTGPADLGVAISYSVSGGPVATESGTTGQVGFGVGSGGFSVGTFGIGIGIPIGGGGRPVDSGAYRRTLKVEIDRLADGAVKPAAVGSAEPDSRTRVFEAQATSEGPSASLAPVIRPMVRAIFQDFPGESGKSRIVRVPVEEAQ